LPNAPTPNFIIQQNFFAIGGDTIKYAPAQNYDTFVFGAGALPTNGINSIQLTSWSPDVFTTGPNNPKNYAGVEHMVNAACIDVDGDGFGTPGDPLCPNGSATDCNNNNNQIHPGATELCSDDVDNDCDGLDDCADSACAGVLPDCIPTVSQWGVLTLALVLANAGAILVLRRSNGAASAV